MSKQTTRLTDSQTYSVAHSAQCKLSMTAGDPDRNLRFMLGHAFLLDKALYRVAEIEEMGGEEVDVGKSALGDADENEAVEDNVTPEGKSGSLGGGSVSFSGDKHSTRNPDNALNLMPQLGQTESAHADRESAGEAPAFHNAENDNDGEGLGLTRFTSASEMPPRLVPDEDDVEEADEALSPPSLPADLDVSTVLQGPESEDIHEMYDLIQNCPCHGSKAEKSKRFWEVKDSTGVEGRPKKRLAIMQVDA